MAETIAMRLITLQWLSDFSYLHNISVNQSLFIYKHIHTRTSYEYAYILPIHIPSSAVITRPNIVGYFINCYRSWYRISNRCWIHKTPYRVSYEVSLWIFVRKLCYNGTALCMQIFSPPYSCIVQCLQLIIVHPSTLPVAPFTNMV